MPYVFLYEEAFVWAIGVLIVGLLLIRVTVARRRRRMGAEARADRGES